MSKRNAINNANRWVIKVGSSLLTNNGEGLNTQMMDQWAAQIAELRAQGRQVILVSSGAVAAGMVRLGWQERPASVHELQAAAAVGQMGLVQAWEQAFQRYQLHTAQVLVDHDDLSNRERYLNARTTLKTLLDLDVIPIVNENDTVVTDEIRFGDNDTLAALVANLIEANVLVLMTDQEGMYNADPRSNPDARLLSEISANDTSLDAMASGGGKFGRGGMVTKVRAARLAARSGSDTYIVGGQQSDVIRRVAKADSLGTLLFADNQPQAARKLWLAGQLQVRGRLTLDDGAVKVLKQSGRSLLPVGIKRVSGQFTRGELVTCVDLQGVEVARGLANYNAKEAERIIGRSSDEIESLLGYKNEEEMIHRDNLVVL